MVDWYQGATRCLADIFQSMLLEEKKTIKHVKSTFLKFIYSHPLKKKKPNSPSSHCNTANKKVTLIKLNNLLVH